MTTAATFIMNEMISLPEAKHSPTADTELVERAQSGESIAFRQIYQQHRGAVYRVVARMIINEADREEIAQEVFLQVFRSLPKFRGTAKLSTWIHRVALNVVLQHIRRKKSRIRLLFASATTEHNQQTVELPDSKTPEDHAIQQDRRVAVERTLETLSAKKRAVLVLHDFEGFPAREVGEIVGCPTLTVRTRLFYARREFYDQLAKEPACAGFQFDEKGQK
jgi:RNA polymerase sigma-70 factor, ECF subfamily